MDHNKIAHCTLSKILCVRIKFMDHFAAPVTLLVSAKWGPGQRQECGFSCHLFWEIFIVQLALLSCDNGHKPSINVFLIMCKIRALIVRYFAFENG